MNYFIKEYLDCLRQVIASFDANEVNKEFDDALVVLQKKVQFPGYRAGKVPFDIIEKNYADDLMRGIVNNFVMKVADKLHTEGVQLYSEPRFKPLTGLSRNNDFSFSMVFDVVPRVIQNIDIESASVEFDEYFYDDKMMSYSIQKDFKNLEAVNGKIEAEDTVTVKVLNEDFKGEKEKVLDTNVVKSLIGKKTGDKVKFTFADLDVYAVDFLGKIQGDVEFEVVKVERPAAQELTDELVQQVSVFKTAEEYKNAMKSRFDSMEKEFNAMSKKNALMAYISKNAKAEFPKSEYIQEARREVNQYMESNFFVSEISLSGLLTDKKVRDDFSALPDKVYESIVFYLAVKEIANQNGIRADQVMIDKIARSHAKEHEMSIEEFKQKASKEEWTNVMEMAKFETALDFLLGKVKFKSKSKMPLIKVK